MTDRADGYCEVCSAAGYNDAADRRREKQTDPFYHSPEWRRFRKWYLQRFPLCAECGRPGQMVDHKRPISNGGAKLDQGNAQTLCFKCHNRKTGRERVERGRSQSPHPSRW